MRNIAVNVLINVVKIKRAKRNAQERNSRSVERAEIRNTSPEFSTVKIYVHRDREKFNFVINGSATPVTTKKPNR